MANIKNELNNIKSALYGKDVRSSIYNGIDAINKEVENTTGRQVDLENTFNQLVINAGNSNAEIVDARVKNDGTSYSKLGDRLDAVDSQLEHMAISVKSFGAKGDGITDDTEVFKQVFSACEQYQKILIPSGEYIIKDTLVLKNKTGVIIECYGTLIFENNGECFVVEGGSRNRINNLRIKRNYKTGVSASEALLHNGFVLRNSKYNTMNSLYVEGCKRGIYLNATESSTAYNHFYEPSIFNCLVSYENDFINGFSNEIKTFGGRFSINESLFTDYSESYYVKIASGSDMHVFNGVTMEGKVCDRKILCSGSHCVFEACRFEQTNESGVDIEVQGIFNFFIANRFSQDSGGTQIVETGNARYNVFFNDRELNLGIGLKLNTKLIVADSEQYRYTPNLSDTFLLVDATNSSDCAVSFSLNEGNLIRSKGREITIIKKDASSNSVRVSNTDIVLRNQYDSCTLFCDGEEWIIKHRIEYHSSINTDSSYIKVRDGLMIQNIKIETTTSVSESLNSTLYRTGFITITLPERYSTSNYSVVPSISSESRNLWVGVVQIIDTKTFRLQLLSNSILSDISVCINAICFGY